MSRARPLGVPQGADYYRVDVAGAADSCWHSSMAGAWTLKTYPEPWVIIRCDACGRERRYRRTLLIKRFGEQAALPDVIGYVTAGCKAPRYGLQESCARPYFVDPRDGQPWARGRVGEGR